MAFVYITNSICLTKTWWCYWLWNYFFNSLFRLRRHKKHKSSVLLVFCEGNSPMTVGFHPQKVFPCHNVLVIKKQFALSANFINRSDFVSMFWRYHELESSLMQPTHKATHNQLKIYHAMWFDISRDVIQHIYMPSTLYNQHYEFTTCVCVGNRIWVTFFFSFELW